MKVFRYNWHTVEVYDSIQDTPVTRFQAYNLNAMLDAGIGSDMDSFVRHRVKAIQFAQAGDLESAEREFVNMEMNLAFIMSNTSPEMQSFASLVKSIDGEAVEDISEDGIKATIARLGKKEFTLRMLREGLSHIKKKFDYEFSMFFPNLANDAKVSQMYLTLKNRSLLILQSIITGQKKLLEEAQVLEMEILTAMKPKQYYGADGLEVKMINNFPVTCTMLEANGLSANPKGLTALEYLRKVEILKDIIKQRLKQKKWHS